MPLAVPGSSGADSAMASAVDRRLADTGAGQTDMVNHPNRSKRRLTVSQLTIEPAPAPLYVCAIETKYIEDWRLFRTFEAARAHLEQTAKQAMSDVFGDDVDTTDHDGEPLDPVEWFQDRDSTYLASIQELTVEG